RRGGREDVPPPDSAAPCPKLGRSGDAGDSAGGDLTRGAVAAGAGSHRHRRWPGARIHRTRSARGSDRGLRQSARVNRNVSASRPWLGESALHRATPPRGVAVSYSYPSAPRTGWFAAVRSGTQRRLVSDGTNPGMSVARIIRDPFQEAPMK